MKRQMGDKDGVKFPLKSNVCSLSIFLDSILNLDVQVLAVARSIFAQLKLVHLVFEIFSLAIVTQAILISYCKMLYVGLSLMSVQKLQLIQNAVSRLLIGLG